MRKKIINYSIKNREIINKVNAIIKMSENKKGIKNNKYQIIDKKYNEYCEIYNRANPENKVYNTNGGWKNKKYSTAKSQWQWKMEKDNSFYEKYKEEKENKIRKIKTHQAVILYDGKKYDAYNCEIEKINNKIIVKIIYGRKKLNVEVKKEIEEYDEEMIKLALIKNAEIYTIKNIL